MYIFSATHEPNVATVQPSTTDSLATPTSPLATAVPTSSPSPTDQPHPAAAAAVATLAAAAATSPG